MWCDFLCCVTWRDAMWCHVMCSHVMSWHLLWRCCEVMRWLMSLWCHVAGCDVTLCGSKWLCDVVIWYMTWSSVLQNTSSTSQCYKVLASTTPVLFCTTTYYSNITSSTPLLFRTTQYYKYSYSVLQIINPFDSRNTWNVQYNARSNKSHPRTPPNIVPATKKDCHDWSSSHMKQRCIVAVQN